MQALLIDTSSAQYILMYMNKNRAGVIILTLAVIIAILAIYVTHRRYQNFSSQPVDQKRIPGDSMTERAMNNAMSGKQPMDGEALPTDDKPKSNNLQGEGAMQGGVILEGSADLN